MTKADESFLKTLKEVVVANMQNPDFCLDDMASLLNMSRSSLNRKIKGILDMTKEARSFSRLFSRLATKTFRYSTEKGFSIYTSAPSFIPSILA